MAWQDIAGIIRFFDSGASQTWVSAPGFQVIDVVPNEQVAVLEYLEQMYHGSETARNFLEQHRLSGLSVQIGTAANGQVGFGVYGTPGYIGVDLSKVPLTYYMNDHGQLVQDLPALMLMHELQHAYWGTIAADPSGSQVAENTANYDDNGWSVNFQNNVAKEMGWLDNIQSSYATGMAGFPTPPFTDLRPFILKRDHSYTNEEVVAITRFGDALGNTGGIDNLDQTAKGESNDLLIGFGGNDLLNGGGGRDFIYGGSGDDTIIGGSGNDEIYGGMDEDQGVTDGIDQVTYSASTSSITVTFDGTGATPSLIVEDGEGGTDTLHSIEKVVGTAARDSFVVLGTIPDGLVLTFDAFGGQSSNDMLDLAELNNAIHLTTNGTNGTLKNKDGSGSGAINLLNFNTTIVGTRFNDNISDSSPEDKAIQAGSGDDTIQVSGGWAQISGGTGSDILIVTQGGSDLGGGGGDDLLIAGDGGGTLSGGEGADILVGGAGAEQFQVDDGDVILDLGPEDRVWGFVGYFEGGYSWIGSQWEEGVGWTRTYSDRHYWGFRGNLHYTWEPGSTTVVVSYWNNSTQIGKSMTIEGFQNGDGGIWLVPDASDEPDPGEEYESDDDGVVGSPGDDAMQGTPGDDKLSGAGGNDTLAGGTGDDKLYGGEGDDTFTVSSGDGSDVVAGGTGFDTIIATGNDVSIGLRSFESIERISANGFSNVTVSGTSENDIFVLQGIDLVGIVAVRGGSGDDTIYGGYGDDRILGEDDNDRLFGAGGTDTLIGGAGDDMLDGGDDDDVFRVGQGHGYDSINGGDGTDTIKATANSVVIGLRSLTGVEAIDADGFSNVSIRTTDGDDSFDFYPVNFVGITQIDAGGGHDVITGNASIHRLRGGDGDDALYSGAGDDHLFGDAGDDRLDGGYGNDNHHGGAGNDYLIDLYDDDTYHYGLGDGSDIIDEYEGHDILMLGAGIGVDDVAVSTFDGDMIFDFADGGRVLVYAGVDSDYAVDEIRFAGGSVWTHAQLLAAVAQATGGDDMIAATASGGPLWGLGGNDTIGGNSGIDTLFGGGGNDALTGLGGNDRLAGGAGNDVLNGGLGDDMMIGGAGDDAFYVQEAGDTTVEAAGEGYDTVRSWLDHALADDIEVLRLFGDARIGTGNALDNIIIGSLGGDTLKGMGGADTLWGQSEADILEGGDGADILYGELNHDMLDGGAGDDRINGEQGDDILTGGDGTDRLFGGDGRDTLGGGAGNDDLKGNAGKDTSTGGAGLDTFVFDDGDTAATAGLADVITDFTAADGDRIHLRQVDAVDAAPDDQNFTFLGTGAFSANGTGGELRWQVIQGNTYVQGDTNGDGVADLVIRLDGTHVLTAADFVL